MSDLDLTIGGDLMITAGGQLQLASGTLLGQQRVMRRLVTAPNDYLWHPTYGAGLAQSVGDLLDADKIEALIRSQILQESVVSATPAPEITVQPIPSGVFVNIRYVDAQTGEPTVLSFNVNR